MNDDELTLRDLFQLLWKRLIWILIVALLCGGAGYAYSKATAPAATYQAQAKLYVYNAPNHDVATSEYYSDGSATTQELQAAQSLSAIYLVVLKSDTVLDPIIAKLNLDMTAQTLGNKINVAMIDKTQAFTLTVTDADPARALEICNAIAQEAPTAISRVIKVGGVEVIDYAKQATKNAAASPKKNTIIGALAGAILSFGVFFLVEIFRTSIQSAKELSGAFPDVAVLGTVPVLKGSGEQVLSEEVPAVIRETYSDIRTRLLHATQEDDNPFYVVTSALPSAEKTQNAINLAISMARLGKRTILVDGDMREPSIHAYFNGSSENGLSEVLAGKETNLHFRPTAYDDLYYFPAGQAVGNASELLSSRQMTDFLSVLRRDFDCIIFDMPPVGMATDASVLAKQAQGYILSVRAGKSHRQELTNCLDALHQVGGQTIGFILNGTDKAKARRCRKNGYLL